VESNFRRERTEVIADAIVVASLLKRKVQRRAEHEEKGGAVANSIWTLNPTG